MRQLTPETIAQVSAAVAEYIASQRDGFRNRAVSVSSPQKARMAAFFRADLLASTRILELAKERIGNPGFYPMLAGMGLSNLPDFALMQAVTFHTVVVSHVPLSSGLLFHELVHIEQYRQLGLPRFAELYVRGFLSGGGYHGIPLEISAYELGARFAANPDQPFSVENEVASWVNQGRF